MIVFSFLTAAELFLVVLLVNSNLAKMKSKKFLINMGSHHGHEAKRLTNFLISGLVSVSGFNDCGLHFPSAPRILSSQVEQNFVEVKMYKT